MAMDRPILWAAIESRDAWERVKDHVKGKELGAQVQFWWNLVSEYYGRDTSAKSVTLEVLREIGEARIKNPKHKDALMGIVEAADKVSAPNVVTAVLELKRYNAVAEFAGAAMSGAPESGKMLEKLNELWQLDTIGKETVTYAAPIDALFDRVGSENRIPVLPRLLNDKIAGGVLPGHHVVVFGRTEVGKSCFSVNWAAGMLRQKQRVLYIGNEDEISGLKKRLIGRVLKRTSAEIDRDRDSARRAWTETGYESCLSMVHLHEGGIGTIRREMQKFEPTAVILDQIRGLSGPEDGLTQRIEHNAIRFRNLLSEHNCVGLSVAQAGDRSTGHNQEPPIWLGTGDVDSSRVGLAATADLMLGIGANNEMLKLGQRAISICKNKLSSEPNSREGIIVNVDLQRSIMK